MSEVAVIISAVHDEAKKWRDLSDRMVPIQSSVNGLDLSLSAFFIGDMSAGLHSQSYNNFQSFMETVLGGAVTEFDQIGTALDKIADAYDRVDQIVSLDLNKIYSA